MNYWPFSDHILSITLFSFRSRNVDRSNVVQCNNTARPAVIRHQNIGIVVAHDLSTFDWTARGHFDFISSFYSNVLIGQHVELTRCSYVQLQMTEYTFELTIKRNTTVGSNVDELKLKHNQCFDTLKWHGFAIRAIWIRRDCELNRIWQTNEPFGSRSISSRSQNFMRIQWIPWMPCGWTDAHLSKATNFSA